MSPDLTLLVTWFPVTLCALVVCARVAGHVSGSTPNRWAARGDAEARAQELLARFLTTAQLAQLNTAGFIEVPSGMFPGRTYLIPRQPGQVRVAQQGCFAGSLCIQPTRWVPDSDAVLMHKLMIEGNEAEYLRMANRFSIAGSTRSAGTI